MGSEQERMDTPILQMMEKVTKTNSMFLIKLASVYWTMPGKDITLAYLPMGRLAQASLIP